ncbi:antitoxin Xre/MbcA/ParS toxin-binding domain-containing protein [Sagittula sp.]|uniref:antitoxin Xre/MbcA/ParS toxin-binding domain-containing protein n=1 Tax=Sagittula sp. TaxID=2038081 RepID=UPI003514E735
MPKKSTPFRKMRCQARTERADRQPERAQGRGRADFDLENDGATEILELIEAWTGSRAQAIAWYETEPLPSFDNMTAAMLVRQGHADAVRAYIERIADGGYA